MLFVCNQCHAVDDTELAGIDTQCRTEFPYIWLCTECQGRNWHAFFPKAPYNPTEDRVVNRPNGFGLE